MKYIYKRKIKCDYCNKIIDKAPCKTKSKHNFCNLKCYLKAKKERGELTGGWKGGNIKFNCKFCGKSYSRQRSGSYMPKYCSIQCAADDRGKNQSGSNHWKWKGGNNSRYLKKTAPRSRPKKCEICGSYGKKRNGIVLDHNHKTAKFRGWLCSNCNTIIGLANENTKNLEAIINYLKNSMKTGRIAGNPIVKTRAISSRAIGKTIEGSETRDTTVSPQHPAPKGDDIVRYSK